MKAWIPAASLLLALAPLAFVHPLRVRGRSMDPTLRDGELRLALRAWVAAPPRRGEVWLVAGPEGPAVKRIVALPGERVELLDGDLRVDGRHQEPAEGATLEREDGSWSCGQGYFVLGDHRPQSRDSRAWGPLPRASMRGRLLGL